MDEALELEFKALRRFIESSDMPSDEQLRAKVMLSNLRYNADRVIRETAKEIDKQVTEKVEAMRKDFKKAYTELANNYIVLEKHRDKLVQQLSEVNSRCGMLDRQLREKENSVEDKEILSHIEKVRDGNISFKDDVDMGLIVDLYMRGYGAGRIKNELKEKEIVVARQTVVNRLTRIGLWDNKVNWLNSQRTKEELDYIKKHNIDIASIVAIVKSYTN